MTAAERGPGPLVRPAQRLQSLVAGYRSTAAIGAAVRLGIPEMLGADSLRIEELASRAGIEPIRLGQFLRALVAIGVLAYDQADGTYRLTEMGALLRPGADGPFHAMALIANEVSAPAYSGLATALEGSQTPFERHFGTDIFRHLEQNPELARAYGESIATPGIGEALAGAFDFSGKHVVDVGGGTGELIEQILQRSETARGTVFDLAATIAAASRRLRPLADRADWVAGSFHTSVPAGADVYVLCRVIANWADEQASVILRNCRQAMGPDGTLLIVEVVRPATRPTSARRALGELDLHVHFGGRLRTLDEWTDLLATARLQVRELTSLPAEWSVIRVAPALTARR